MQYSIIKKRWRFFRKMYLLYQKERLHRSFRGLHEVRFVIPFENCPLQVSQLVSSFLKLAQLGEMKVTIKQAPIQANNGNCGTMSWYYEGKLEFRVTLHLQREFVLSDQLFFQRINSQGQPIGKAAPCNNHNFS